MRWRLDALFSLPLAGVVTWNWDTVLDLLCILHPPKHDLGGYGDAIITWRPRQRPPLLKLQGSVSQAHSLVLDENDYIPVRPVRDAFLRRWYLESDRVVLHVGQGLGGLTGGVVGPVLIQTARDDAADARHYAIACDDVPRCQVEAADAWASTLCFILLRMGTTLG